ncbi:MAG TPA: IPT/TIG domain-containing protein, partial [Bryobacteraceae bacterium]
SGDGASAAQATITLFQSPRYDAAGNLYFVDRGAIRRIDTSGTITTFANVAANSLAIDSSGNIYFTDSKGLSRLTQQGSIQPLARTGNSPSCVAGGDGGPIQAAQVCYPHLLAIDGKGNLYFSEATETSTSIRWNHIRRVSPDGTVTKFAGYGPSGSYTVVTTGGGIGDRGPALNALFYSISGLAADNAGNVYVTEQPVGDGLIRKITPDGTISTIAGGNCCLLEDGPIHQADVTGAVEPTPASDGTVYFVQPPRIRKVTPQATVVTAGGGNVQPPPDGTAALHAWLYYPNWIAVSRSGNLYIGNHGCQIQRVGLDQVVHSVPGTPPCAISPMMAVDSQDQVYLATESGVYVTSPAGMTTKIEGTTAFAWITTDFLDRLYVSAGGVLYRSESGGSLQALNWTVPSFPGFSPGKVRVDSSGHVYVQDGKTGQVFRFDADGSGLGALVVSNVMGLDFVVDSDGSFWAFGGSTLTHLDPSGAVIFRACAGYSGDEGSVTSACFGQFGGSLALSPTGDLYVLDQDNDAIRRIRANVSSSVPATSLTGIVNSASLQSGAIAPGELISIMGSNFSSSGPQSFDAAGNQVPTELQNVQVFFDGHPGAITAIALNQINVFVPSGVAGNQTTSLSVFVGGTGSASLTVPVWSAAFGLFTANETGSGQGAILNQDQSVNSSSNPAPSGSVISLFGTGAGLLSPPLPDGSFTTAAPFPKIDSSVLVNIGGQPAEVLYAGAAPFLPNGIVQINARIPPGTKSGDSPISVIVNGIAASQFVTCAIQ